MAVSNGITAANNKRVAVPKMGSKSNALTTPDNKKSSVLNQRVVNTVK